MKFAQNDVVQTTQEVSRTFDISGVKLPWRVPIGTVGAVVIAYGSGGYEIEVVHPGGDSWFFNARADQLKPYEVEGSASASPDVN